MHITVAIDDADSAGTILSLLAAARFREPQLDLVHVLEGWDQTTIAPQKKMHLDLIQRFKELQEKEGQGKLDEAARIAQGLGLSRVESHLLHGFISNQLFAVSTQKSTPLLAIGTSGKSRLEGLILGSVARKAVINSPVSVLVAKKKISPLRPLNVVFATDHSDYASACLAKFAQWAPAGIGRFTLLTVFPQHLIKALTAVTDHFKSDIGSWLKEELEERNKAALAPFHQLGYTARSRVESDTVVDKINEVMLDEQADLLVLGAQGRGFIERITAGSLSLSQVVGKPYSVLVMRR